ncbi:MAG: hypothetical protein ABI067_03550 [Leifsonia sp.]
MTTAEKPTRRPFSEVVGDYLAAKEVLCLYYDHNIPGTSFASLTEDVTKARKTLDNYLNEKE